MVDGSSLFLDLALLWKGLKERFALCFSWLTKLANKKQKLQNWFVCSTFKSNSFIIIESYSVWILLKKLLFIWYKKLKVITIYRLQNKLFAVLACNVTFTNFLLIFVVYEFNNPRTLNGFSSFQLNLLFCGGFSPKFKAYNWHLYVHNLARFQSQLFYYKCWINLVHKQLRKIVSTTWKICDDYGLWLCSADFSLIFRALLCWREGLYKSDGYLQAFLHANDAAIYRLRSTLYVYVILFIAHIENVTSYYHLFSGELQACLEHNFGNCGWKLAIFKAKYLFISCPNQGETT